MTLHELLFKIRPLVNASGLEILAGIPKNTLCKHYHWVDGKKHGKPCSHIHSAAIERTLADVFGNIKISENA